jgi:beta-lactamase class D
LSATASGVGPPPAIFSRGDEARIAVAPPRDKRSLFGMNGLPRLLLVSLLLVAGARATPPAGIAPETDPALGQPFAARQVSGVFVALDARTGKTVTNDPARAAERFLPCSTFKIPNSLIALECGAVETVETVIPWDHVERWNKAWNRDYTMREALPRSTVWFYQELARRVGPERMQEWLQRLNYGNADISGGIDRFWLDGALRISALEQLDFLRRFRDHQLPFRPEVQAAVLEILIADHRDDWVLRGKTGTALEGDRGFGWYVGWVETPQGPVYFALNLDTDRAGALDARPRKLIAYEALVHLGALPAGTEPPP